MAQDRQMFLKNEQGKLLSSSIKFEKFEIEKRASLVEYLRKGWKLDVSVAVDFSLSNLEINDYRSLHRIDSKGELN